MDLRRYILEVKGIVTKLHAGVTDDKGKSQAGVPSQDGQGQMWEVLWEADLVGIITLGFGMRSFNSGAKTREED